MSFRLISVYSGTILVHFVSFRCYSASFRHIPVYSVPFLCLVTAVVLVYSALFCCHSASFWYIPVPLLLIPSHSDFIRFYSRVIPPCSGIFRFIPSICRFICVSFRFIPVSFRCHSGSFRYIPVPFLFSPVYSVPFRSVPVFSNAPKKFCHFRGTSKNS